MAAAGDPGGPEGQDDEAELWFLPGPEDEPGTPAAAPGTAPPWPQAGRQALVDLRAWRDGEAAAAAQLARAAAAFGALDERLRLAPPGWRQRLALAETADLSWLAGDRVPADRLALWQALRLGGAGDDAQALARAGSALRRLTHGPPPRAGTAAGLAEFLGRTPSEDGTLQDWAEVISAAVWLHPLSRAALAFHAGRMLRPSGPEGMIEATVVAARLGAVEGRGGAPFLPLATAGAAALRAGGPPAERLARWYRGAESAALAGLLLLERLSAWEARALEVTRPRTGRTPPRLLAVMAEWPLVSAPMAEDLTGASRAAVQRNLARLEADGLIREMTGQGRYRFWAAALS